MAISFVNNGTFGSGTTSCLSNYPAGAASDVILTLIGNKPFSSTPSVSGYTSLGTITSGSVANAVSSGSVRATAGQRNTVTTAAGSDTVSVTSGSPTMAIGLRFATSISGAAWSVSGIGLADTDETLLTVSATGTFATDQLRSGDVLVISVVLKDDAITHSTQLITIAGITHGAITWLAQQTTTSGNDGSMYIGYCAITAGSSTGSATYSATSSVTGASAAAVNLVRLREITPTPTGLAANEVSSSEIDLTWDTVTGATSYTLERSPDGSTGWSTVYTGSTASFNDTGLTTATTYYYRVSATGSAGTSSPSSNVSGLTKSVIPISDDFSSGSWAAVRWKQNAGSFSVTSGAGVMTMTGGGVAARVNSYTDTATDQGLLLRFLVTTAGNDTANMAIRSNGTFADSSSPYPTAGYSVEASGGTANLVQRVAGSPTTIGTTATYTATAWQWIRLEAVGSTIRWKIWQDGTSEPGSWRDSVTDTAIANGLMTLGVYDLISTNSMSVDDVSWYVASNPVVITPHTLRGTQFAVQRAANY